MPGDRLLVTEDTTSTGGSAEKAISAIYGMAAEQQIDDVEVVGVCTVLDRGTAAAERFAAQGIAFIALTTFEDFGLDPLN
jgi:orotate phosphoribosyltransferase